MIEMGTSYSAAIGKAIRMTKAMCARDSAPTAKTPCEDCAAEIEALRALAQLVERAERVSAATGPNVDLLSSGEHASFEAWCSVIDDLAAGFQHTPTGGLEEQERQNDPNDEA